MHRLIVAFLTACTLILSGSARLHAQSGDPVEPTHSPQAIDEPTAAPQMDKAGGTSSSPLVIAAGSSVDHVDAYRRKVVIAGHVNFDVQATDCEVVLEKSATVAGVVRTANCTITNKGASGIHLVSQEPGASQPPAISQNSPVRPIRVRHKAAPGWFGAQLALAIFGLLGAALAVVAAPNFTKRVSDHISAHPKRDMHLGVIAGLALFGVLFIDAILLNTHTIISYLWAPFGIMLFFAPMIILGIGWLTAMRATGEYVARRMNRAPKSLFTSMAMGLFTFFALNVVLGTLCRPLGVLGLCAELTVALMGLGAATAVAAGGPARA